MNLMNLEAMALQLYNNSGFLQFGGYHTYDMAILCIFLVPATFSYYLV